MTRLRQRGIALAWLTHAAGLSSTGDPRIDAALPLPENYHIPERTAELIAKTHERGNQVIAIGTTVVRALEASAETHGHVVAGSGTARGRIDRGTPLRAVDGLLTGMHEIGASHYRLLNAFAPRALLEKSWRSAEASGFQSHELVDLALIHRSPETANQNRGLEQSPDAGAKRKGSASWLMPGLSLLNQLTRHH